MFGSWLEKRNSFMDICSKLPRCQLLVSDLRLTPGHQYLELQLVDLEGASRRATESLWSRTGGQGAKLLDPQWLLTGEDVRLVTPLFSCLPSSFVTAYDCPCSLLRVAPSSSSSCEAWGEKSVTPALP